MKERCIWQILSRQVFRVVEVVMCKACLALRLKKQQVASDGCRMHEFDVGSRMALFTNDETGTPAVGIGCGGTTRLRRFAGIGRWFSMVERVDGRTTGIRVVLAIDSVVFEPPFNVAVVAFVELNGSWVRGAIVRLVRLTVGFELTFFVRWVVGGWTLVFRDLLRLTRWSCSGFIQSKSPSLVRLFSFNVLWNNWRKLVY